MKYTHVGGVLVACRNSPRGIRFEVWDTGVGIAPDQQDLVFREFYKGSSNVGTSDGFGLGLAIVTQLTDLLGYELSMRSRLGRGTQFQYNLALLKPKSLRPPCGKPAAARIYAAAKGAKRQYFVR